MADAVVVIGGGPAGLMAAEVISASGIAVDVYDAMPTMGRKFLRAGIGGLNLTHSEDFALFRQRYGDQQQTVAPWLADFGPQAVRDWAAALGSETFVGSSGRVFPTAMKAAHLLRAWLHRLHRHGVRFHPRHRWQGWSEDGALRFATPDGDLKVGAGGTATVLALGGGSWARLGSNGAWLPLLTAQGVAITPLSPSNCGFNIPWSTHLRQRFAGAPVKNITITFGGQQRQGEFLISRHGIEGSLVYALSAPLRDTIIRDGRAIITIDLSPDRPLDSLISELQRPQGRESLSNHLRRRAGIEGVKAGLLREVASRDQLHQPAHLAALIKALPLTLTATRPIDEAISTAGGVCLNALSPDLMLPALPGVFCAGEMLDWDAPTGGYLLTACLASGYRAGHGLLRWLARPPTTETP